jgi:hypothetical protein
MNFKFVKIINQNDINNLIDNKSNSTIIFYEPEKEIEMKKLKKIDITKNYEFIITVKYLLLKSNNNIRMILKLDNIMAKLNEKDYDTVEILYI